MSIIFKDIIPDFFPSSIGLVTNPENPDTNPDTTLSRPLFNPAEIPPVDAAFIRRFSVICFA